MLVQTPVWCDRLILHRCAARTSVITKRGPLLARTISGELFIHFLQLVLLRHNNEKTFLIWINEEDHTRIISMEKGGNMKRVFERFCRGLKQVQMRQTIDTCRRDGTFSLNDVSMMFFILFIGGAADPGKRVGIYVERASWLRPHMSL